MMTIKTMQAYPAALERIKSGRHMSGAKRRKKIFVVPLRFFGFTNTISRFGKRFGVVSTV